MRYRPLATLITATAAGLLLTATARADFQTLYDDYRADGGIDGCAYSSSYLSAGLSEIPADVREYDPGFSEAINTALEQVAAGCGTAPSAAATRNEATAADGSPGPVAPRPLAFRAAASGPALPAVLAALVVVLATALAAGALLAASHYYGWDLRGRLASVSGAARQTERRLADGLRSVRDRLGF
jgi:hypothetical protein